MYGAASSDKLSISPSKRTGMPRQPRGLLKAFAFATRRNKWLIFLASLCQMINGVTIPLTALVFGSAINVMSDANVKEDMSKLSLLFVILAAVSFVTGGLSAFIFEYVADVQLRDMKRTYLRSILGLEIGYFDLVDTGTLSADIEQTSYRFRDGMGQKFGLIAQSLANFIGSYAIGFTYHWSLCLVMSAVLPLTAGSLVLFSQLLQDWIREADEAYEGANAVAEEALGSMRTISAFGLEKYFFIKYSDALVPVQKIEYKASFWLPFIYAIAQGAPFISFAIGMLYATFKVRDRLIETDGEDMTLGGDVITVLGCVYRASGAIGMMVPSFIAFSRAAGSVRSVLNLCHTPSQINPYEDSGETRGGLEGRIRFKDVRFSYPSRPDRPVYDRLNLEIKAGETVALVGPSGCGKSTVVQLIQRFYDVGSGSIEIDGLSHKEFNLQWLRSRMALVSQEPRLFTDTIENNIRAGAVGFVTEEDVIEAAKAANAHDFIMKFPKGYQTNVGQGGSLLSGGQKQRIAIARAIIRDPAILILDEATSALDTESEQIVQAALDKLVAMKKRTTIIIAHRLTTIQRADKICVLDNPDGAGSKIIEIGSHDTLMALDNGIYRALAEAQQIMTEGDPEEQAALQRRIDIGSAVDTLARERSELRDLVDPEDQKAALIGRLLPTVSKTHSKNMERLYSKEDSRELGNPISPAEKKRTIRRMFREFFRWKWLCICGSVGALLAGSVFPLVAWLMATFTAIFYDWNPELPEDENVDHLMSQSTNYVIGLFGIAVGMFCVAVVQWLPWGLSADRLCALMRKRTLTQYLYLGASFHDKPNHTVGRLSSVLSADCNLIRGLIGYNTSLLIETFSTLVTGLILAFQGHAALAAVCFVLYLLIVPCIYYQVQATVAVRTTLDQSEEENSLTPEFVLNECITNLRSIAAYNLQAKFLGMYDEALMIELKRGRRNAYAMGTANAVTSGLLNAANAATFAYAAQLLDKAYREGHGLDLKATLEVLFTGIVVAMRIAYLSGFVTDLRKSKAAAENIHFVLDQRPILDVRDTDGISQGQIRGELEFDDIHFRYPSRPNNPVLGGVTFNVDASTTVALVGSSGSGKSTIVQLIERFYCLQPSPQVALQVEEQNRLLAARSDSVRLSKLPTANDLYSGEIRLDGKPLQEYNLKYLRSQIGLVGQEPCLFETTIKENILLGCYDRKDEISDAEIINACKLANAHSFIMEQPDGYETNVGKGGGKMSGGQKQRLAIARALIRDPKILLLDEATSALDVESERVVQKTIDDLLSQKDKPRTSIMIAHRLATVRQANKITVFAPRPGLGSVVIEEGTHQSLMAMDDGAYRKLVELSHMADSTP